MDIAPLTFRIESSSAVAAEGDLDQLTAAAGRADTAQESLAASAGRAAAAETNMSAKAKAATQAINAHTAATKANAAAMNMQAVSAGQVAARQQQMMFQTNDIAMSLASGQAPYMVAIQQGSQLAQVYAGPGGLNNAIGDFNKLMGGVIGTLVKFAPHFAAVTALVTAGVLVYRDMTRNTRELDDAFSDLRDHMADGLDVLADTHDYTQRIDLAKIGREAAESVGPANQLSNELTGIAAALNDITVARTIEQITAVGEQIRTLEADIARIEGIRDRMNNGRLSPADTFSATGSLEFGLSPEDEQTLYQSRIQLWALREEWKSFGSVLSEEDIKGSIAAFVSGDFVGGVQRIRDGIKATLEDTKTGTTTTGRAIDEAGRAMERLQGMAQSHADAQAQYGADEIERILFREQQQIRSIEDTAAEAIRLGAEVHEIELLRETALTDLRLLTERQVADARIREGQRAKEQEKRDFIRKLEEEERERERWERDRERISNEKTSLERSLQPGTAMQQVSWWEDDQQARNDEVYQREVQLYGEKEARKLGLYEEYERRRTEITRLAAQERRSIEAAQNSFLVGASAGMFDALSNLYGAYIDERSDGARTLFAIAKGLSLAQTTMDAYEAVGKAWTSEQPLPVKIAESIMAFTSVMNAVAGIQSVNYGGGREFGGGVRPDEFYEVNEKGKPELLNMGSKYYLMSGGYGQVEPAIRMPQMKSGAAAQALPPNIQIINNAPGVVVRKEGPEMNPRFIIEQAKAEAAAQLQDDIASGGDTSQLLERRFGLNRAAGSI